jgi:hypothetical protein
MRLLPVSAAWVLVVSSGLALAACSGKVIVEGGPGDERDAGGDDGPPTEDVVVIDVIVPPPYDAPPPPPEDAPYVEDTGACLVDLEPCIYADQCCSNVCESGTCGDVVSPPPPACLPDGAMCDGTPPCCSGPCVNGFCGDAFIDSGPPISCSAPTGNACFECLASACCPALGACEDDPECNQALACFQGCYAPGQGAACSSKCNSLFPAPEEASLTSCGAMQCPSCD